MRKSGVHMHRVFCRNGGTLLLFELIYRTASYLLMLEVMRQAVNFALQVSGYSNLTAENFLLFLQHPVSILLFFLVGILFLFLMLAEVSSLLICMQYSSQDCTLFVGPMLLGGLGQALRLMRRRPVAWILGMGILVPFWELQFLAWEVFHVKLLEYALQQLLQAVPHGFLLVLLAGVLLYTSYIGSYALPYLLLEGSSMKESLRRGHALRKKHPRTYLKGAVLMQLLVAAESLLFLLGAMSAAVLFAMQEETRSGVVSALLLYSDWARVGIGLAAGALTMVALAGYFFTVYDLGEEEKITEGAEHAEEKRGDWHLGTRRQRGLAILGVAILLLLEAVWLGKLAGNARGLAREVFTGTQITAHRGGANDAPENTLRALAYSMEQHADYAEIDVQETKDGVLVLMHDENLKRTTGAEKDIWNMNYDEIQKLDAGSSFGREYAGERVPTLREAVRYTKDRINLIMELKDNGHNPDIVEKVMQVIRDFGIEDQVIICSMHYGYLQQVKEADPSVATSYVMPVAYGAMENLEAADCVSIKHTYLNPAFVRRAHQAGKLVHAWTINSPWRIRWMQQCQVDNVITDSPAAARQVLKGEWAQSVNFWELLKYVL